MKFRHLLFLCLISSVSLSIFAGPPELTFNRVITKAFVNGVYSPRIIAGVQDSEGGVYITGDLGTHSIYYLPRPLGDQNAADYSKMVFNGDNLSPKFGSTVGTGSWLGISIDSNGTVFATGPRTANTAAVKITRNDLDFTVTQLALPSGYSSIRLGGCTAVGPDRFVAPNYLNGSLHFFHVSDSNAFLEGVVSAPSGFSGYAPQVHYANGKIYMTNSSQTPSQACGGLWAWTSDGTPEGTNTPINLVEKRSGISSGHSYYSSIGFNDRHNIIAINEGHFSYGQQGWRIYDATQTELPWEHYRFLNGGEPGAPGVLGTSDAAMGAVFFKDGEEEYFMGSNEDDPWKLYVYKLGPRTSVEDWSVY